MLLIISFIFCTIDDGDDNNESIVSSSNCNASNQYLL